MEEEKKVVKAVIQKINGLGPYKKGRESKISATIVIKVYVNIFKI